MSLTHYFRISLTSTRLTHGGQILFTSFHIWLEPPLFKGYQLQSSIPLMFSVCRGVLRWTSCSGLNRRFYPLGIPSHSGFLGQQFSIKSHWPLQKGSTCSVCSLTAHSLELFFHQINVIPSSLFSALRWMSRNSSLWKHGEQLTEIQHLSNSAPPEAIMWKKLPFVRGGQIKFNITQQNGKLKSCVQDWFFLSLPLPLPHQRFVKKKDLLRSGTPKLPTLGLCLSCSDIEWSRLISISKRLWENLKPAESQSRKHSSRSTGM